MLTRISILLSIVAAVALLFASDLVIWHVLPQSFQPTEMLVFFPGAALSLLAIVLAVAGLIKNGKSKQSERGEALRHPFTGVALALECGVPDAVCHIIAAHAAEGDLVKRTTEALIVHHADFMAFLPFKNLKF